MKTLAVHLPEKKQDLSNKTKLLEKTVNSTDYVKLKEQNCFCVQQDLTWMQFSPNYLSLIKLMIYLQMILRVTGNA